MVSYRICKMLYKRYCKPCVPAAGSSITFRKIRKVMVIPQCRIQTLGWKEGEGGVGGGVIRTQDKGSWETSKNKVVGTGLASPSPGSAIDPTSLN